MKIKQHKEKLEIIRNIIRETLLGNAAIVVLVSMIIVLCRQEWTFISMLFTSIVHAVVIEIAIVVVERFAVVAGEDHDGVFFQTQRRMLLHLIQ